jgi:hypothetical protein
MYSKKSWGGSIEPFILLKFLKADIKGDDNADPLVSVLVWEFKDSDLIGKPTGAPQEDVSMTVTSTDLTLTIWRVAKVHL